MQLAVDNITKEFLTRGEPLVVLRGVSLKLGGGQNVAILGPSGSGKSTLLHILGTLDSPTSGRVALDGTNPFDLSDDELAKFRNRHIGFVFQEHHLLPQLSVLENVLIPILATGRPDDAAVRRAHELLERVGLTQRLDHRPAELSGGERQRVAVARSLIARPGLVLADEPTGSLDKSSARAVGQLLLDLQSQENATLVIVTHSQELAALCQKRLELDDGQLVER